MTSARIQYKLDSADRTRRYLQTKGYLFVELSPEQKQKLEKLENEIKVKEDAKVQGRKTAEKTGIPENVATLDVVKIAMMLGLVKSKAVRDGLEKDSSVSLLDMFLGKNVKQPLYEKRTVNFSSVPPSFHHCEKRVLEEEKLEIISTRVKDECEKMTEGVKSIIEKYKEFLKTKLMFHPENDTIDAFKKEGVSVVNDLIDGVIEDAEDQQERNDILELIAFVRNHLIGFLPIENYKNMVLSHVKMMENIGMCEDEILTFLSPLDAHIILFPNFQHIPPQQSSNQSKILLDVQIRCFTKNPQTQSVDVENIRGELCKPSLAFISVQDVLKYGLIGPYNNNSIGYLETAETSSFYLLKEIKNDIRLWVVDPFLEKTLEQIRLMLTEYLSATFITFYREVFGDNVFRMDFLASPMHKIAPIFNTLLSNILFVNSPRLDHYVRRMIQVASPIIPTELDMFNGQKYLGKKQPNIDYYPEKVIQSLFIKTTSEVKTFIQVYYPRA